VQLVYDQMWPDGTTYRGAAFYGIVEFTTWRTGLPPLDEFNVWLARQVVEFHVTVNGGSMLEVKCWNEESTWGFIPTYNWRLEYWFHGSPLDPATIAAIASAITTAIVAICIVISLSQIKEIIWGGRGVTWGWIVPAAILLAAFGFAVTPIIVGAMKKGG